GESTVGKFASGRLQSLGQQAQAELVTQQNSIDADAKALEGQRATLSTEVYQQRADQLQLRVRELQRVAEIRNRELQATQDKARQIIYAQLIPIVRQAFTQRN